MRLLAQHEAEILRDARGLLYSIAAEQMHSEERGGGYLAGKAESAEDAIFDFLNSQHAYADDPEAKAVLHDLPREVSR